MSVEPSFDGATSRQNAGLTQLPRTVRSVIRYEHPLNERIRTLMRLEDLYRRAQFFAAQVERARRITPRSPSLFEITDVAARADLKTDLLQELERQKQLLAPLRSNPAIEPRVLEPLLADIDRASAALLAQTGKAGVHLRDNEWLMTIKQRTAIPGGVCEFDLPAYHYWLQRGRRRRGRTISRGWIEPFLPIYDGLSDRPAPPARQRPRQPADRVPRRVPADADDDQGRAAPAAHASPRELPCVPEISANKYALNIRFIGVSGMDRGNVVDQDVVFELMFCNL